MRKAIISVLMILFVSSLCYAQSVRNPTYNYEGKSNYGNLSVNGLDVTGNPGYIELYDAVKDEPYYLYVASGVLCITSSTSIREIASFPTGSWGQYRIAIASSTAVGTQNTVRGNTLGD